MSNDVLKIGTLNRFHLDLSNLGAPTGTPQISIEKQGVVILVATNTTVRTGTDNEIWYYDYTIPDITVGQYEAVVSYTVDGDAGRIISEFDIVTNNTDDVKTDTETIIAGSGISIGANTITINVKDDDTGDPIEGVNTSVHNADNDDTPKFGTNTTDSLGNTPIINLNGSVSIPVTYIIRLSKNGSIVSENEEIIVTISDTKNLTVTALTVTPPSTPGVCAVRIYPSKLGYADVTDAKIYVTTLTNLSEVGGLFLDKRPILMTHDTTTELDSYYIEVVYGAEIRITSTILGLNHTMTVPSLTDYDVTGEEWS